MATESGNQERDRLVARVASAAAAAWTAATFAELARESRPVTGGWPGTLSEARARAAAESMGALTHEELVQAARLTNAEARRAWLENRVADEDAEAE